MEGVYITLTANFHGQYIRKCIENHKAVLCEKPFTVNAAEAEELFALAEKGEKLPFYVKPMEKMSSVKWSVYMSWSENTFIELFYIPRARRSRVPNPADDLNYTHYSLEVSGLQAFRRQVLRRGGAPYIDRDIEMGLDNTWVMWMHDPDGNPFEIMEYTPASFQVIGR